MVFIPEELKLTEEQLESILLEVGKQRLEVPSYRFGQGIYNLLPKDLEKVIYQTELDFFYWTDNDKVLDCIYSNLVKLEK